MFFNNWFPEGLWAIGILGGIDIDPHIDLREAVSHICTQM